MGFLLHSDGSVVVTGPVGRFGHDLAPELRLLLCCCRPSFATADAARARGLMAAGLDWRWFFEVVMRHGVAPLVFDRLRACGSEAVPPGIWAALQARSEAALRHSLAQTRELFRLIDEFGAAGIPLIPVKGVIMASLLNGGPALRESSDLDLLVKPEQVDAATELLLRAGYRPLDTLRSGQVLASRMRWHARAFGDPSRGTGIDLHWRFADFDRSFGISPRLAWERAAPTEFMGRKVLALPPDLVLLVLCAHGARHQDPWSRLKWVCDVAGLLQSTPDLDWAELWRVADRRGCRRMTLLGIALAVDLLHAPVPTSVGEMLRSDSVLADLVRETRGRILTRAPSWTPLQRFRYELALRDRRGDRVRLVARRLTTPTRRDWNLVIFPRPFAWLYRLAHIVRLTATYFLAPWRVRGLLKSDKPAADATRHSAAAAPAVPIQSPNPS